LALDRNQIVLFCVDPPAGL